MKYKLTSDEMIQHMKSKGISFELCSESCAREFLENNNYYLKLTSYRKNFEKFTAGENKGKYIKLDFWHLKELSTIDMYIRYLIIEMCLDLEHKIKVILLDHISKNENEDGYNIVRLFLSTGDNINVLKTINKTKKGEYNKDLINKYYPYFPIWVFVEVIPFGSLLYLCDFYQKHYKIQLFDNKLLNDIRDLRNASAHSSCMLNNLLIEIDSTKQVNKELVSFVIKNGVKNKETRSKNLNYRFTNHFITLLYMYDKIIQDTNKKKKYNQIYNLMIKRIEINSDNFKSFGKLKGVYNFNKKIVDNLRLK